MPTEPKDKKPETPDKAAKEKAEKEELAVYLQKMKRRGARLCKKCDGKGFTRDEETRAHKPCKACKGTGSTLRRRGELQAFVAPKYAGGDPSADCVQAGWERVDKEYLYQLIIPGEEDVLVVVADAEIDAAVKEKGADLPQLMELIQKKVAEKYPSLAL